MSFPTFLLQAKLDAGVYTLHDLRVLCRKEDKHWCPYYLARHMLAFANVIVYNYQYMLDPKVIFYCLSLFFLNQLLRPCLPSPMSSCTTTSTCSTARRGVYLHENSNCVKANFAPTTCRATCSPSPASSSTTTSTCSTPRRGVF